MTKTSCIILAGGKGERMDGDDKGLKLYRSKRLIEHVIDRIAPQVDEIIISANRNLAEYSKLGCTVIHDKNKSFDGPLAGIASALPHCRHQWVLIIPCDMPDLPDDLVASLLQHINTAPLIAVRSNDKLQLIFLMHISLVTSINEFLADNQRTVMRWVDAIGSHIVDMDNENYFHNINTQRQLDI